MTPRIIFHSENGPGIGGSDLLMGKLADACAARGWNVFAMVPADYPHEVVFRESKPAIIGKTAANPSQSSSLIVPSGQPSTLHKLRRAVRNCLPVAWRRRLGYERAARRTVEAVRETRADLLVAMDGGPQPTVIGARRAGCRTVSIYNAPPPDGPPDAVTLRCSRLSYRSSDACASPSGYCSRQWARYLGVPEEAVPTIANGVALPDRQSEARASIRRELGIEPEAIVVGMTGRLDAVKGPLVLAAAARIIALQSPATVFAFTGIGSQQHEIEAALRQSGVSFRMPGFRTDAADFPAAYDIAVVPSLFAEPFGLVVAEAMAWGTPVVASRVGGIPEVLGESAGLLVPPGDPAALTAAIRQLIASPDLRGKLGAAGRRRVEEQFTLDRQIARYFALFDSLLPRGR